MQRVTLHIGLLDALPGLRFEVLSNADRAGLATGSIDTATPVSGAQPQPYRPLEAASPGFLRGPFLEAGFLGPAAAAGETAWITPPLYHGVYRFQARSLDAVGNATSGDLPEYRVAVRSGPRNVRRARQTAVSGGRPVFGHTRPAQFGS